MRLFLIVILSLTALYGCMSLASAGVSVTVMTGGPYGAMVEDVSAGGSTFRYGQAGQWLYAGHKPYHAYVITGGHFTYYLSTVTARSVFNKLP
jgi:hypothetical protein